MDRMQDDPKFAEFEKTVGEIATIAGEAAMDVLRNSTNLAGTPNEQLAAIGEALTRMVQGYICANIQCGLEDSAALFINMVNAAMIRTYRLTPR